MALAWPPIFAAVCARKCSTMTSARWPMLVGCSDTHRASADAALPFGSSGSSPPRPFASR